MDTKLLDADSSRKLSDSALAGITQTELSRRIVVAAATEREDSDIFQRLVAERDRRRQKIAEDQEKRSRERERAQAELLAKPVEVPFADGTTLYRFKTIYERDGRRVKRYELESATYTGQQVVGKAEEYYNDTLKSKFIVLRGEDGEEILASVLDPWNHSDLNKIEWRTSVEQAFYIAMKTADIKYARKLFDAFLVQTVPPMKQLRAIQKKYREAKLACEEAIRQMAPAYLLGHRGKQKKKTPAKV